MTRRLGVILPSVNTVVEPEFAAALPDGVSCHFARARLRLGSDAAQLEAMRAEAPEAAAVLADTRPERIMFACTSGSFVGAPGADAAIADAIQARVGIPTTTAATAVVKALRSLGARRVALGTPYLEWVGTVEAAFLEDHGFEVVSTRNLGMQDGLEMAALAPDAVAELARSADRPEADAVFLSCTALPTLHALPQLEDVCGKPVVSSNSAMLWDLLGSTARLPLGALA
jgi:maleate isomerase